eukprot:2267369-Lingulodinium_polyedra.AAC.1
MPAAGCRFIIVCPARRERVHRMYSDCRERLVRSGVPLQCITRGRALDLNAMPEVHPSRVLM